MTTIQLQPYLEQLARWPTCGQHILANYDANSICIYQAYRPSIARYAVEHQRFGEDFSYARMSWIKPNFLWMMYRSGWATKVGQAHVVAVRLRRTFFDELLSAAVDSTFDPARHATREAWQRAVTISDVRLQWDPDHDPLGRPLERRAVQLGLRGNILRRYGEAEILSIEDITPLVIDLRGTATGGFKQLLMPQEQIYVPALANAGPNIGLTTLL